METVKKIVARALDKLYQDDAELFEDGVCCERCLVFRFAHHLQNLLKLRPETHCYYVDCDFDASTDEEGTRRQTKPIRDADGTEHNRYVDVIVHKRRLQAGRGRNGYFCIEFKRWDNYKDRNIDEQKLRELTSTYDYEYGFFIILNKNRRTVKHKIYVNGESGQEWAPLPYLENTPTI